MKKHFVLILFFSLIASSIFSQEKKLGTAVLLDFNTIRSSYSKLVFDTLKTKAATSSRSEIQFFHWDEKKEIIEFRPTGQKKDPVPCEKLVFLKMNIHVKENLDLILNVDSTGKTTSALFNPYVNYSFVYKMVDFGTSKIDFFEKIVPNGVDLGLRPIFVSYKEFFETDPNKLKRSNPKEYNKNVAALRKEYNGQIQKMIRSALIKVAAETNKMVTRIKSIQDDRLFKIKDLESIDLNESKKIKEFTIDAGLEDDIQKGEILNVIRKTQYGDFVSYEKIDLTYIKDVGQTNSTCKSIMFTGKKMTKALRKNEDVYFNRNSNLLKELSSKNSEIKSTVSIDKKCILCGFHLEQMFLNIPNIDMVERIPLSLLTYFVNLSKSDKHLEYNVESIQGKQQGVRYIISFQENKVSATDVETGRIFNETSLRKGWLDSPDSQRVLIKRLLSELFEIDVQIVQILNEKKGKIKEVLAYHPLGFSDLEHFYIYEISSENVKGKTFERKIKISGSRAMKIISNQIAKLFVYDGKKELYEALNSNKKIVFINE